MPLCPGVKDTFRDPSTHLDHPCTFICYTDEPENSPVDCQEQCPEFYECLINRQHSTSTAADATTGAQTMFVEPMASASQSHVVVIIVLAISAVLILIITITLLGIYFRNKRYRGQHNLTSAEHEPDHRPSDTRLTISESNLPSVHNPENTMSSEPGVRYMPHHQIPSDGSLRPTGEASRPSETSLDRNSSDAVKLPQSQDESGPVLYTHSHGQTQAEPRQHQGIYTDSVRARDRMGSALGGSSSSQLYSIRSNASMDVGTQTMDHHSYTQEPLSIRSNRGVQTDHPKLIEQVPEEANLSFPIQETSDHAMESSHLLTSNSREDFEASSSPQGYDEQLEHLRQTFPKLVD